MLFWCSVDPSVVYMVVIGCRFSGWSMIFVGRKVMVGIFFVDPVPSVRTRRLRVWAQDICRLKGDGFVVLSDLSVGREVTIASVLFRSFGRKR